MAYATVDDYRDAYPDDDHEDEEIALVLDLASDCIDGELADAEMPMDGWSEDYAARVTRICIKVAHRSAANEEFEGVPYGTTQMNASGGSYSRGFSFGSDGFGDVFLTRNEKLQLGIGRSRACVLSPYGGES